MRLVLPALAALLGCASTPPSTGAGDAAPADRGQVVDVAAMDAVVPEDVTLADVVAPTEVAAMDVVAPADVVPEVAQDAPRVAGPYPEGPYGNREGAVLANLAWEGYVNETGAEVSTALPFGPTTLQDLRGDGRGYALIHLAEFL